MKDEVWDALGRPGLAVSSRNAEKVSVVPRISYTIFLELYWFWLPFDPEGVQIQHFYSNYGQGWKMRSRSRSWENMEFRWKTDAKLKGLEGRNQAFRFILASKYQVWAVLDFSCLLVIQQSCKINNLVILVTWVQIFQIMSGFSPRHFLKPFWSDLHRPKFKNCQHFGRRRASGW